MNGPLIRPGDLVEIGAGIARDCRGSLLIVLTAIVLSLVPGAAPLLALRPEELLHGEAWRLFTGHLVHYGVGHLAWDAATFVVLSSIVETMGRRRWLIALLGSAMVISAGMLLLCPTMEEYRGLSGVDSALFVFVAVQLGVTSARLRGLSVLLLVAFAGKLGFEVGTGSTMFVREMGAGVEALPLPHVLGGLWGGAMAVGPWVAERTHEWRRISRVHITIWKQEFSDVLHAGGSGE